MTVLKILTYALVSTWSLVSSGWEHVKQKMHPWKDLTSRLVVLSERSLTMQRRSPEARFEMKRTKMPSPDTTKSVCNYTSKEFQIFFQTLLSLSSMASKVFLKTQFQEGSFRSPLAATSIVENIFYGIRDKTTDNPGFFCCNFVVLIGARACKTRNLWAEPSYTGPHSLPQPL